MPSEKSMEKARELVLGVTGSSDLIAVIGDWRCSIGAILMHGIATALDSAIAETREEDAAWHDAQAKFYDEKGIQPSVCSML